MKFLARDLLPEIVANGVERPTWRLLGSVIAHECDDDAIREVRRVIVGWYSQDGGGYRNDVPRNQGRPGSAPSKYVFENSEAEAGVRKHA